MVKRIICVCAIALIVPVLGFSSGIEEDTGEEDVVLRVWDRVSEMGDVVEMFNAKMEREGRNIRAEFELVPYDQQVSKFMAALSAGTAPDVYSIDLVQYPYFTSIGAFADITQQYEELPYREDLPQGILELARRDGKIYGLPYEIDISHILWNKDLFREAGLNPDRPPEDWDQFLDYSKKLTVDKDGDGNIDQWGFAVVGTSGGQYMFWFMPWVWGNDGAMFDDEGNVVFNSPETVETLQFWHDLIYEHEVAPKSSVQWASGDRYNAFIAGRLAMFLGGNFNITSIRQDAPDLEFGVALTPSNRGEKATFGGGNLIGITEQCDHKEAAWEFMEFAFSEDALVEAFGSKYALIPRTDLYDNKYYQEIPQMSLYAEFLTHAKTPFTMSYNEVYDPVLLYLQGTLLDRFGAEEAVQQAHDEIKKLVE
jgi:multiple sugar transport system substrate-binding protein